MNRSLLTGICVCSAVAVIIWLLFESIAFAILIGGIYFLGGLHITPVAHRSYLLYFGKRPPPEGRWNIFRGGKEKDGFGEGWNWLWLTNLFMKAVDESVAQKRVDLREQEVFTKDSVVSSVDAFVLFTVTGVYRKQDAEDAEGALIDIALRSIRWAVAQHKATALPIVPHEELSKEARKIVSGELQSNRLVTGIQVDLIRFTDVRLNKEFEAALRQRAQEPIEGQAEQIQARRRKAQRKVAIDQGVSPDMAAVTALVDAGKPGARVFHISGVDLKPLGLAIGRAVGGGGSPRRGGRGRPKPKDGGAQQ
jgi:regulator of protease activity HflC (stomatin/prohibitin superfamily)